MPLNPPLTLAQLDPIAVRKDQADISALLWAIKRLPIQMLRVDQAQDGTAGGGGISGMSYVASSTASARHARLLPDSAPGPTWLRFQAPSCAKEKNRPLGVFFCIHRWRRKARNRWSDFPLVRESESLALASASRFVSAGHARRNPGNSLALASASRSIGVGHARRIPDSAPGARGFDSRRPIAQAKKNRPVGGFLGCYGGGGGNRTRVRKHSTDSSTYLALPFNLTGTTRTCTLCTSELPII